MTRIFLIRHGHSESNGNGCFTGQTDAALSSLGVKQAQLVAERLQTEPISAVYSSDLSRAVATAKPTADYFGLPIRTDKNLREIEAGEWSGQTFDDLIVSYPETFRVWREDFGRAKADGGEAVAEVAERAYRAVEKIIAENKGKTVAVFSHATPVRLLCCRYLGIPIPDAGKQPWGANASISLLEADDEGNRKLVLCGEEGHLQGLITVIPKDKA